MTLFKVPCADCGGAGVIECECCQGSGECICSKCEAEHECGWCEGEGEYECKTCKGSGMVIWQGEPLQPHVMPEEATCSCGRPAVCLVGKDELCALCEAKLVLRRGAT